MAMDIRTALSLRTALSRPGEHACQRIGTRRGSARYLADPVDASAYSDLIYAPRPMIVEDSSRPNQAAMRAEPSRSRDVCLCCAGARV